MLYAPMDFHLHFDGPEDMGAHLKLVYDRIIPVLDWLDELTDPERRKVTTALVVLLAYNGVKREGALKETMLRNLSILHDAITSGELDNIVPFRRP